MRISKLIYANVPAELAEWEKIYDYLFDTDISDQAIWARVKEAKDFPNTQNIYMDMLLSAISDRLAAQYGVECQYKVNARATYFSINRQGIHTFSEFQKIINR